MGSASSQCPGNQGPLSGSIKLSGLQVNDKFFTTELDDIICNYLFALADLFSPVDLYLTIGNQHFCLSPSAGHAFEFQYLKELDRLFCQDYFFHKGYGAAYFRIDFDGLL